MPIVVWGPLPSFLLLPATAPTLDRELPWQLGRESGLAPGRESIASEPCGPSERWETCLSCVVCFQRLQDWSLEDIHFF